MELKWDNLEALKEWDEWMWYSDPNHANVIQQLNQQNSDPNLNLVVRPINSSQNALARYLAEIGSMQRLALMVVRRWFGEVKELWMLDMGLGTSQGEFELILEDEDEDWLWEGEELDEDANVEVAESQMMIRKMRVSWLLVLVVRKWVAVEEDGSQKGSQAIGRQLGFVAVFCF